MSACPGCGSEADEVCCSVCWERAPRNLPTVPRWRATRQGSLKGRPTYPSIDTVDQALTAWLKSHPLTPQETAL